MTQSVFLKQRPVDRLACRQILWSDGPWTGREIEPAWENDYELQGYKPTATCKECGFKKLCVLTSLTPTEVPPPPPSPPTSWCCLKCVSPEGCVRAQGRRPEPMMMNWGNASKTYASIPQDTAEHNRRELVAFCQGCWHFTDFWHNKGTIAALELMTKLKIDAHRTASGTQDKCVRTKAGRGQEGSKCQHQHAKNAFCHA